MTNEQNPNTEAGSSSDSSSEKASLNLLNLSRDELRAFFESINEKPFRADQVMKWIHHEGVDDFHKMTNLGKALRQKLSENAVIEAPKVLEKQFSSDGTRKWILEIDKNNYVETVFIPGKNRGTLCVSSQVGCALDCSFCSTGKQGFQRDLTVSEIVGQIWVANRSFEEDPPKRKLHSWAESERHITNVVMMGMGEPLLNFDAVVKAMKVMKDDFGYGISKRRVTLSTSGVVPKLYDLVKEIDVALAISLHAPNDELRDELVPINKKYPLKELLEACRYYLEYFGENRRRITMEYVLLAGVNDSEAHAKSLARLLKDVPSKINLIPFNSFPNSGYKKPDEKAIEAFRDVLIKAGYVVTLRTTRGDDIDAACGQLVGKVLDRTRRQEQWEQKQKAIDLKQL
jgi:23S rRNA (adenine2503-C2)-methyltransferase